MEPLGNEFKIFDVVFLPISVEVVDVPVFFEGSAEELFHREAMLVEDSLVFRRGEGVIRAVFEGVPLNLSRYEHPYSGRMREVLVETFSGACRMTPCGDRVVYDLTVDEANHYISQ